MHTLDELCPKASGKKVLVRADLNVPMRDQKITDTTRIEKTLPTLNALLSSGASVILMSHFGRPKGQVVPEMSLAPVAKSLGDYLSCPIHFAHDSIGTDAVEKARDLKSGEVLLLENLRFHEEEERNDKHFAEKLAALGDVYVNDAFSTAHRAHASTEALAHLKPAYAGLLMQSEINALTHALETPKRPVLAIVGGSKISTKLDVLNNLIKKTDILVLGGAMANTFLYANGHDIGASLCEHDMKATAQNIMAQAKTHKCEIILPIDAVCATALSNNVPTQICDINAVSGDQMILDIGPKSVDLINNKIDESKTILWNGPVGAFETAPFDQATTNIAQHVATKTRNNDLISIAGGGDTVAALSLANVSRDLSYISTAGGAFLEWIEGKSLPGIIALQTTP